MRACDYIAERLYRHGVRRIYGLMGGGAAGLNDGFIAHEHLAYICFHHEQGAGHAAVGESKLTRKISVVNPTTGCGGTNCITSVLAAWQDGVPVIFISGNVSKAQCSRWINQVNNTSIRKYGIQEHDIVDTVSSMTKFAKFVTDVNDIPNILEQAIVKATTGRPGPVWIDIPADLQTADISTDRLFPTIDPSMHDRPTADRIQIAQALTLMSQGQRPVILAGQGIHQSNTVNDFAQFVERQGWPYVSTYGARDLMPYQHRLNIGAVGIKGSRAGNFVMQCADTLLVLGCSVNTSHVGYDQQSWTPFAKRILIDIDQSEFKKNSQIWYHHVICDLRDFFQTARELSDHG